MKTETEIAKENVEWKNEKTLNSFGKDKAESNCKEHLSTLRRWLDFLCCLYAGTDNKFIIKGKITDIKQAIAYYKENGIE